MTGKGLLICLGDISYKYYDEAEKETFAAAQKRRTLRTSVLLAAIIALMALLVGCAVVYALRLQDMSIGKENYTQSFDDSGRAIEPVEKIRDVLTLFGHNADAIQRATAEWFAFLETYEPDEKYLDNNPDHADIPNQYEYTYDCDTPEMAAKVDEIAARYELKLLEEWLPFQAWQSDIFLEETGVGSLLLSDSGAEMTRLSGFFYPPHNFEMDMELDMDGVQGKPWVTAYYAKKDYFPRDYPGGADLILYEQWDYTAPDGTPLLLALSSKGHGYIIAEPQNAMMILSVDGNFSISAYPEEDQVMTKAELEAVANVFDYSIQPQILDRTAVAQRLEESNQAHDAENAYVPETFGSFADYVTSMFTLPDEGLQYTFYDLTGDAEEELLIGRNGAYHYWTTLRDGQTLEQIVQDTYLCENGVTEWVSSDEIYETETHIYAAPVSASVIDDIDAERTILTVLKREKDQWTQGPTDYEQTPITEEQAKAVMNQYSRVELEWKPLLSYPISEEQTFGDYLEAKDVRVSQEQLLEIYKKKLTNMEDMHFSHYRILDINGDGVDDLLLKGNADPNIGDADCYGMAMTYRYGQIVRLRGVSDFYLCENGVLEKVTAKFDLAPGVEIYGHQFTKYAWLDEEPLEFIAYNKATASWQGDWYGEIPMTEEEANAILARYPRIDQGMRPISELLN